MKNALKNVLSRGGLRIVLATLVAGTSTTMLNAEVWRIRAGAQSGDLGSQALGFLPNELWIHASDGIQWIFSTDEIHTITFLAPGQVRPPLFATFNSFIGCPGASPDFSSYTGANCVTSAPLSAGQKFTVYFPAPGNFKLVCLVHPDMTGAIHVVSAAAELPYDQSFYDREGRRQATTLVADATSLRGAGDSAPGSSVNAGISAIVSTGGGAQTAMLARFLQGNTAVRVGDTVEWVNGDASLPHTITFGTEPADPRPPSANVLVDADGARHATIGAPGDSVNWGIMPPTPQDRPGWRRHPSR